MSSISRTPLSVHNAAADGKSQVLSTPIFTPTEPTAANYVAPTPDQHFTAICNIDTDALPSGIGLAANGLRSLVMTQVHNGNLGRVIDKVTSTVSTVGTHLASVGVAVGGRAAEAVRFISI